MEKRAIKKVIDNPRETVLWLIIREINKKAFKIGHQEAYDFIFRIYYNIQYEQQQ